jgi:two-component system sensor histidine kinase YcbA
MVVFGVEDNGKGINKKERELVFEPGFTTKFNPETGQVSTGLGLTHIKMLTEHYKGRVIINNDIEGITEFRLEIPVGVIIYEEDDDV